MRQLSGLDDSFLALEGPATPLHVTSLTVLDGSTLPDGFGYQRVLEHFAERIRIAPVRCGRPTSSRAWPGATSAC